ncbi:hypothetical protein GCM10022224_093550 [Nonomuraea antimicrobica]|uniref:PIN domain-containing protein n=1 Tax=Nonomuraea antimicrobica TaxID=561173 RepID=A0ABP7E430_9ACTN
MTRSPATPGGTLVLDSEGLAKAVLRDRTVTAWLALARADDLRVITSAAILVEVVHPPRQPAGPGVDVVPPCRRAGHRTNRPPLSCPTPACTGTSTPSMPCSVPLAAPDPVTVLTSDPEDLAALCGVRVTVVKI